MYHNLYMYIYEYIYILYIFLHNRLMSNHQGTEQLVLRGLNIVALSNDDMIYLSISNYIVVDSR